MLDKLVNEHIILGIDPGTLYMGYALLQTFGSKVEILDFGVYDVHKLEDQYARLQREFFFIQNFFLFFFENYYSDLPITTKKVFLHYEKTILLFI